MIRRCKSHHCAKLPRHKFTLTVAVQLAFGWRATCAFKHLLKDQSTHLLDALGAVNDLPAVDIYILFLTLPKRGVGCEL